jgi:hypothetical protein
MSIDLEAASIGWEEEQDSDSDEAEQEEDEHKGFDLIDEFDAMSVGNSNGTKKVSAFFYEVTPSLVSFLYCV